jgi:hypothetical protein
MKKLAITIAIVLGLGMTSFADSANGGLFQRGEAIENNGGTIYGSNRDGTPMLPSHGQEGNQPAPLGSGIAVLTALGAAYLVSKRKHED